MRKYLFLLLLVPFLAFGQQNLNAWDRISGRWATEWDLQVSDNDTISIVGVDTVVVGPYRTYPYMTLTFTFIDTVTASDSIGVKKIEFRQSSGRTYANAVYVGDLEMITPATDNAADSCKAVGVFVSSPNICLDGYYPLEYFWLTFITNADNRKVSGAFAFAKCVGWNE